MNLAIAQDALRTMLARAERLHEDHRPTFLGETKDLLRALEKVKGVQDNVARDRNLSEIGRRERIAQAAKQAIDLSALKKVRERKVAEMQCLQTEVFGLRPRADGIEGFSERMDEQEIRQAANGKPQGEVLRMFEAAVSAGNHTVVRALSRGPLGSLIPGEVEARILREHAAQAKPAHFTRLQSLVALDEHLAAVEHLAAGVLQELTATGVRAEP